MRGTDERIFGMSAGRARDAYDSAEAGFNIYMERAGLDLSDPHAAIEWLVAQQARLPRQTRRDEVQLEFQQFSTPPAQALVLVKSAALRPGMKVLEPSAGTGNIAVLARMAGAEVDTNEIDERRLSLLSLQGFEPTALDAERLDNLLPADKLYDAIVMNPPFSATGGSCAEASHGVRGAGWRWSGPHFASGGPTSSSVTAFGRTWVSTAPRTPNSARRSTTRSSWLTDTARFSEP